MEGYSHDSVGIVEGFLDSIAVMDIDIQVEHSGVDFEQFQDADDDVVDVAEPAGFSLLGMVVPSCPIDSDVRNTSDDYVCSVDAAACCQLAEMIQSIEAGAIEALVDLEQRFQFRVISNLPLLILFKLGDNLILFAGDPFLEVFDVGLIMEETEFILGGFLALEHDEVIAEFIALDERVCHLDAFCLHGVLLAEVVVSDRVVVQVAHLTHSIIYYNLFKTKQKGIKEMDLLGLKRHEGTA